MKLLIPLVFLNFADCAKILAIFQLPFYSHQLLFQKIVNELAARGHELTVFSSFVMSANENITHHLFDESVEIHSKVPGGVEYKRKMMNFHLYLTYHHSLTFVEVTANQLQHPEIQKLFNEREKFKFDLVIIECLFCPLEILADIYNSSKVVIFATEATSFAHQDMENDVNPLYHPEVCLPFLPGHLSFLERVESILSFAAMNLVIKPLRDLFNRWLQFRYLNTTSSGRFLVLFNDF